MNGLGLEQRFAEWYGRERIYGGLAFTCINRGAPGTVHHLCYGPLTIGHLGDDRAALERAAALWEGARVEMTTTPSLLRARWEKLCWNIPFNGVTIAAGGVGTEGVLASDELREAARALMREVVTVGNAELADQGDGAVIDGDALIERIFALTETMGDYQPSTLIDFLEGRPLEIDAIFREPLRRAQALGVQAPRLELLTALLGALPAQRRGAVAASKRHRPAAASGAGTTRRSPGPRRCG